MRACKLSLLCTVGMELIPAAYLAERQVPSPAQPSRYGRGLHLYFHLKCPDGSDLEHYRFVSPELVAYYPAGEETMKGLKLTRRDFLQHFGAAGGASLLFGAMNSLELMAAPAGPRPDLQGRPRNGRVIVLGAGISGLTAAYELGKHGYEVHLLEARDRVGGVNHSIRRGTEETEIDTGERQLCTFDEGLYFNGGPWRIPHSHTTVLDYCKELRVPLQFFINESDASYLYFEGEEIGALSGKRVRLREVKSDMRGYTSELLSKAIDQGRLDLPLTGEDRERLVEYLVSEGYLDSADRVYRGSTARGSDDLLEITALLRSGFANRIRSIDSGVGRAPMFQPIGGMDQIPLAFQRVLGDKISLGTEVRSIRQTPDEVRVRVAERRSGQERELTADYLISSLPLTVLAELDAQLSPELTSAIRELRYSTSAKIGIQMRRRFWEEDDGLYGGVAYTNLPIGQFSYPSNDFLSDKGVLLGFYANGEVGGADKMPISGRLQHVVDTTSKFHPQIREEYENGYCVFWDKIRYSQGAYASTPGPALLSRLSQPDGRIYLGCAAISDNPAWMDGAIRAAWGATERLHQRAMSA